MDSISELERRLESSGYGVGLKVLELLAYRSREVCVHSYSWCLVWMLLLYRIYCVVCVHTQIHIYNTVALIMFL